MAEICSCGVPVIVVAIPFRMRDSTLHWPAQEGVETKLGLFGYIETVS